MKHGGDDDCNGTNHQFVLALGGSDDGEQVEAFPSNSSIKNVEMSGGNEQQQKPRKKRRMEKKSVGVVNVAKKARDTSAAAAPNNMMSRQCTECDKKFWSWKALFGHMRCHPERQWRGINPPPNFRRPAFSHQTEDYEVAACLLLLANANTSSVGLAEAKDDNNNDVVVPGPPACAAAASDDGVIIATTTTTISFECSSCKKVFGSHQALGGHRASHKNVKGCFAINNDNDSCSSASGVGLGLAGRSLSLLINDNNELLVGEDSSLMEEEEEEGHRCSICLRVFSSGQALGGHKRCHWDRFNAPLPTLDLNFPPPAPAPAQHHHPHSSLLLHNSSSYAHPNLDLRLTL